MICDRQKFKRDLRIDFLRGLALLIIFIDHVPMNRWSALTAQNFGFSDAAEMFVALAGYSAALAYGRVLEAHQLGSAARRMGKRIATIYVWHLGTLALVACGLWAAAGTATGRRLAEMLHFTSVLDGSARALLGVMTLTVQPTYFDILPLYVVLLAIFPLLYLVLSRCLACGIGLSFLLWLAVQLHPSLNLPMTGGHGWFFNPLAWQFLLCLGTAAAIADKRHTFPRTKPGVMVALAFLLTSAFVKAPWTQWPLQAGMAFDLKPLQPFLDKTSLGTLRLLHFAALGYLVLSVVPRRARWLRTPVARTIADAGRNSLEVFSLGVVLSIAAAGVILATGRNILLESSLSASGVGGLLLVGTYLGEQMRLRRTGQQHAGRRASEAAASKVEGASV